MAERKRLGDILKEAGLIDEFQLQSALSHQRNWKGKLGSILVELGFIKESELAKVLSEKLRISRVDLFNPEIPEDTINLIKPEIAKKHGVVPVKVEGRVLTVAVDDPMDMEALDEVRFITGLAVKPALAMETEIRDAIKKYYDKEAVQHREELTIQEKLQSAPSQMEIIREAMDAGRKAGTEVGNQPVPGRSAAPQEQVTVRELLESLISLLIEKDLITREELSEMVRHKKIGL
jgi:type IV pilus assembly protein PilB